MTTLTPAANAIIEALSQPGLTPAQRASLAESLTIVMGKPAAPPAGRAPKASTTKQTPTADRQRLTRAAVEAMPLPATGETRVYDDVVPQLAVRLRPSGRTYVVIVWDRERRKKMARTLGKCSALTPEQARTQARAVVGRMADGEDIRRVRDESLTVRQLLVEWHAEKSKTKRTADELRDKALQYLGALADRPAGEISREDIGRIHHTIATKARKRVFKRVGGEVVPVEIGEPGLPATADKWRATLAAVFTWAQGKGLVQANPCEGIQHAFDAKQAARTNYLRGDALLAFWRALSADADADTRDALKLLLFTGQRRGNVLAMRWADVDLRAAVWSLGAKQTKQAKAQTTPLVAQALAILKDRHADAATPWVFPAVRKGRDGEIGPMSETRLRDAWARICKAAGIEDLRPHDLRHTSGSWLARLGVNEAVRQKALGHQTSAMAARYSHLELDPVADALQRAAHAIEAEATRPARRFKREASK